ALQRRGLQIERPEHGGVLARIWICGTNPKRVRRLMSEDAHPTLEVGRAGKYPGCGHRRFWQRAIDITVYETSEVNRPVRGRGDTLGKRAFVVDRDLGALSEYRRARCNKARQRDKPAPTVWDVIRYTRTLQHGRSSFVRRLWKTIALATIRHRGPRAEM